MTILVTGATGTVGRRVVEQLLERGAPVRAVTRDPARAEFPAGVDVVRGDLADPASLESALEGVTGLHLITFDGGLFAPLTTGEEVMRPARGAGVRRVTVLNGGGDTPMETAVRESGLAWTVVMPVEFMANALEWAPDIKADDVVREPALPYRGLPGHPAGGEDGDRHRREAHRAPGADVRAVGRGARGVLPSVGPRRVCRRRGRCEAYGGGVPWVASGVCGGGVGGRRPRACTGRERGVSGARTARHSHRQGGR